MAEVGGKRTFGLTMAPTMTGTIQGHDKVAESTEFAPEVIDYPRLVGAYPHLTETGPEKSMLEIFATSIAAFILPYAGYDEAVFIQTRLQQTPALRDKSAAVTTELWIGPNGKVLDCTVVRYAGSKAIADQVCALMKQRRLRAPKGPINAPTYAISVMTTGYGSTRQETDKLAQDLANLSSPDLSIAANASADSAGEDVGLLLAIDENGRAKVCRPANEDLIERLARYCEQVADKQFEVKRDQDLPVNYVRSYRIRLDASS